jgi:hypothetical protein
MIGPRTFGFQIQGTTGVGGSFVQTGVEPPERDPIGRRIRFLESAATTQHWIDNEIRMYGRQLNWHPTYGMTGTIIEMPPPGSIGGGPRVQWDNGKVSGLGSASRYEYID